MRVPRRTTAPAPTTSTSTSTSTHRTLRNDHDQAESAPTANAHLREVALGVPEVARALGIGRPLAERLVAGGALRVHVIGRRRYVLRADLERWLAAQAGPKGGIR